jgi:hypothetical protein
MAFPEGRLPAGECEGWNFPAGMVCQQFLTCRWKHRIVLISHANFDCLSGILHTLKMFVRSDVFFQQEQLGGVPCYLLRMIPKRKQKELLNGFVWVDTTTFRIQRIEGIPTKKPSW